MRVNKEESNIGTHELIIKTARELFMKKGYRAVTTREIAKACKITQPALYYYFPDKEALYIAMIEKHVEKVGARLRSVVKHPVSEQLEQMFTVLSEDHPTSIMMMIHDISVEFTADNRRYLFTLWKENYLIPFQAVFEDLERKGLLRKSITPEDAARFCLLTAAQKMSSWEAPSLSNRFTLLIDLILNGTIQSP